MVWGLVLQQLSSPVQIHSSVQTNVFLLHDHHLEYFGTDWQLHLTSCNTESGDGGTLDTTGNNLSSSFLHPSVSGSGYSGVRITSWDQMFACRRARFMCSAHTPGVGGSRFTPWSSLRLLNKCHRSSFADDVVNFAGRKSSHPRSNSCDGCSPTPSLEIPSSTSPWRQRSSQSFLFLECDL